MLSGTAHVRVDAKGLVRLNDIAAYHESGGVICVACLSIAPFVFEQIVLSTPKFQLRP